MTLDEQKAWEELVDSIRKEDLRECDQPSAHSPQEWAILAADAAMKERDQLKEEKARVHGLVNDACMKGLQVVRERDAALSRAEEWERDSLQHLNDYKCAMIDIDGLKREIYFLKESHCKDCCCQKSWDALGITGPTDKSIPEHIDALRAIVARIEVEEMAEAIHDAFDGGKFDQDSQQDIELFTARALVAHLLGKEG